MTMKKQKRNWFCRLFCGKQDEQKHPVIKPPKSTEQKHPPIKPPKGP